MKFKKRIEEYNVGQTDRQTDRRKVNKNQVIASQESLRSSIIVGVKQRIFAREWKWHADVRDFVICLMANNPRQSNPHASTGQIASKWLMIDYFKSLMSRNDVKRVAFTLAEVLITLGIIGIVAAMTIPTLMNNIQEAQYKTGYKKAFSVASQAWMSAVADSNIEERPDWNDATSKIDNFNAFKSYFKISKECNNFNNSKCWAIGDAYYNSFPSSDALAFIDNSGMAWSITSTDSGVGSEILVDINGMKQPNKYGQDRFILFPFVSGGSMYSIGLPVKITTPADYTSYNSYYCPSGDKHPCLYKSWLSGG